MERQREEYIEVDLLRLVGALWRHAVVIVLVGILCGGAGFALANWVIPPKYQASVLMYVNNSSISVGSTSISLSDLSASKTLVDTYIAILETRLTLEEVIERAEVDYSYEELRSLIEADAVNNTEIFSVTVTSQDPAEAERIANIITVVLPDKIAQIVDGSSVRTVDYAVEPEEWYSPSIKKCVLIGVAVGLLLSCGLITLRELLDDQIHGEEDLLGTYSLPVLAAVPDMLSPQAGKGYNSYYAAAEGKERL